jgi:hypothetical protein
MRTRKHTKLKRHPIVRFIRGVFRLFRVLFRPKRTAARFDLIDPVAIEPNSLELDRLVTVGELLGQVKWQAAPSTMQQEVTSNSRIVRPHDVSRN